MNENDINKKIHRIYFDIFEQSIDDTANLFYEFGDSVYHMSFATNIQNEFNIQFTMEEYENNPNLQLLTSLVSDKLKLKAD